MPTRNQIFNLCSSSRVFERGKRFYEEHRVLDLTIDKDYIHSCVEGNHGLYDIDISLDSKGNVTHYHCSCPYNDSFNGACKHVVATLFEYSYGTSKYKPKYNRMSTSTTVGGFPVHKDEYNNRKTNIVDNRKIKKNNDPTFIDQIAPSEKRIVCMTLLWLVCWDAIQHIILKLESNEYKIKTPDDIDQQILNSKEFENSFKKYQNNVKAKNKSSLKKANQYDDELSTINNRFFVPVGILIVGAFMFGISFSELNDSFGMFLFTMGIIAMASSLIGLITIPIIKGHKKSMKRKLQKMNTNPLDEKTYFSSIYKKGSEYKNMFEKLNTSVSQLLLKSKEIIIHLKHINEEVLHIPERAATEQTYGLYLFLSDPSNYGSLAYGLKRFESLYTSKTSNQIPFEKYHLYRKELDETDTKQFDDAIKFVNDYYLNNNEK